MALTQLKCADTALAAARAALRRSPVLKLYLYSNPNMTVLPRWWASSKRTSAGRLGHAQHPWQQPPAAVVAQGVAAVKRYYDELAARGAARSRKVKMVLVGTGLAGKTSTVRGLKHGEARPMDEADRTIQLDIWTLFLGAHESRVGVGDLAGQPEYAARSSSTSSPARSTCCSCLRIGARRRVRRALGRWLDVLQAPRRRHRRSCCRRRRLDASSLEPEPMAEAAASLAWVEAKVAEHRALTLDLSKRRVSVAQAGQLLKVQPTIRRRREGRLEPMLVRSHLESLVAMEPPILPSANQVVPSSWMVAAEVARARDGRAARRGGEAGQGGSAAVEAEEDGSGKVPAEAAMAPMAEASAPAPATEAAGARQATARHDRRAPIAVDGARGRRRCQTRRTSAFCNALKLLCNQGEFFVSGGIVFLDPASRECSRRSSTTRSRRRPRRREPRW